MHKLTLPLALACLVSAAALAAPTHETWDREEALRVSASVDTGEARARLRLATKSGDGAAQLELLKSPDSSGAWPAPVREKFLLDHVNELRQEPPNSVSPQVVQFLARYPSAVMVAHEDHPGATVPLFNIAAATAGVLNHWARQESAFAGAATLAANPPALVSSWLEAENAATRGGLLDALSTATPDRLREVTPEAMKHLSSHPELLPLAGGAALRTGDVGTLEAIVQESGGPGMHHLLRQAAVTLGPDDALRLLEAALDAQNPETAALAISILGPALPPESVDPLLLSRLGDPVMGAAAALALSTQPSAATRLGLEALASGADPLAAARAQLALRERQAER